MSGTEWKNRFLVVAHRGASAYEPENTMSAFRRALAMGADAIELDIRQSADGVIVVIHDENLKRVSGIEKRVRDCTYDELSRIRIFNSETIPKLEDVLSEFGNKTTLFIEIKEAGLEEKLVSLLRQHSVIDNVLVISFLYTTLAKVKELEPRIEVGLLTFKTPLPLKEGKKLNAFAILPRFNIVTPRTIQMIRAYGFRTYVWTINDLSLALRMIGYGVDGIVTDRPDIKYELTKQQTLLKYSHA